MIEPDAFRWWELRRAQNLKPTTYICPLCDQQLLASSEHVLLLPEGDPSRRRHAHTECVTQARAAGKILSQEEWRKTKTSSPGSGNRRRKSR